MATEVQLQQIHCAQQIIHFIQFACKICVLGRMLRKSCSCVFEGTSFLLITAVCYINNLLGYTDAREHLLVFCAPLSELPCEHTRLLVQ